LRKKEKEGTSFPTNKKRKQGTRVKEKAKPSASRKIGHVASQRKREKKMMGGTINMNGGRWGKKA